MSNAANNTSAHKAHDPRVVGIYGLPDSGKSTIKAHLHQVLGQDFVFYEGSEEVLQPLAGDLQAFKDKDEQTKLQLRTQAIERIQQSSADSGKVAVVTGHFSFPSKQGNAFDEIWTAADQAAYNLIVYLEVSPEQLAKRIKDDQEMRERQSLPLAQLRIWQEQEIRDLRANCYSNRILFVVVKNDDADSTIATLARILKTFSTHNNEETNSKQVPANVENIFGPALGKDDPKRHDAVLVFDGDKTLASQDTGELLLPKVDARDDAASPLREVFSGDLGYSFEAWTQAALLYDALGDDEAFDEHCSTIAAQIKIHPEFVKMLEEVRGSKHVRAIIVTCGLRRVWHKIIEIAELSDVVQVFGSGRFSEGSVVVTPEIKKNIVERLQIDYKLYVWAFGDSETDLPMLQAADDPILVVDAQNRSNKTKDKVRGALSAGLRPRQLLMITTAVSWLHDTRAPIVNIKQLEFRKALEDNLQLVHTTDTPASRLLATPIRDASISSATLRKAHQNAGEYLARELIAKEIGLQQYDIAHVQEGTRPRRQNY